ncbi:MAG: 3-dehydroquinate synthase [Clostridia bacterium]|nr:3-dehydroquinate synthase [Clostridia bacterium]MBO7288820.1 3-dehydroquinate synthase [Clostridia bacterium]
MIIPVKTSQFDYEIVIEKNCLQKADKYLNLNRKVLIITDSGVPEDYAKTVASFCKEPIIKTVPQGEGSKSLKVFEELQISLMENNFSRCDCVVAVGGGVVGDLSGFAAACYMRGIDFYNIPTTVLSQVDSSIGGKTAINLGKIKNIVGAFYPPKKVLIDVSLLKTLPARQVSNGLAEAVKMALTSDSELFEIFENENIENNIEKIIEKSLRIKRSVVEEDEKETGLRKILNFGHTIGHGIESFENLSSLYHGECVALGMLPMCSIEVRNRLVPVLKKLNLPTECKIDCEKVFEIMTHDKKTKGSLVTVVTVDKIGEFNLSDIPVSDLAQSLNMFK